MTINELIKALQRLKVETESIACLGCGHEHNCGIHGCAIIRAAVEHLSDFNEVFNEDTIVRLAGRCLKVEPARLRELAEADKAGRVEVLPCKVGDTVYWVHGAVITECKVYRVQKNRKGLYICLKSNVSHGAFRADLSIGKTVFLTREEAEKALEAMKDE